MNKQNDNWCQFLTTQKARLDSDGDPTWNDTDKYLTKVDYATTTLVIPCTQFGILRLSGSRVQEFLQGQLTCNLDDINPKQGSIAAHCNPKGRVLSNFYLLNTNAEDYLLIMHRDLLEEAMKALEKYRIFFRRDVSLQNDSADHQVIGISGAQAAAILQEVLVDWQPAATKQRHAVSYSSDAVILQTDEAGQRFLCLVKEPQVQQLWQSLALLATPISPKFWRLEDIRQCHPWIRPQTSGALTPHMLNLDLLGAVSFDKGCYTGQEVVARTEYLGQSKRRTFAAQAKGPLPSLGDALYGQDGHQAGTVLDTVAINDTSFVLIASGQINLANAGKLFCKKDSQQALVIEKTSVNLP